MHRQVDRNLLSPRHLTSAQLLEGSLCSDQLEGHVAFLTSRVSNLETALKELTRRHLEVCQVLQREVALKDTRNEALLRENGELKKELNDMLDQVRAIVGRVGKGEEKGRRGTRIIRMKAKNKENDSPEVRGNRCITNVFETETKSLPRTELSRVKLKEGSSDVAKNEQERKERGKLRSIKEEYYYKSDQMKMKECLQRNRGHRTVYSP